MMIIRDIIPIFNMEKIIEGLGLVSAILIAIMFVPQVVHVHKSKDTNALDYKFLFLNMLASTLGLVYSIYFVILPMIVANTSAGLFAVALTTIKYQNELKDKNQVLP